MANGDFDRTPDGRPFLSCTDCGGRWSWPRRDYGHAETCPRFKARTYPVPKEEAACPVHDYAPALGCPTCLERGGDADYWTPVQEFG